MELLKRYRGINDHQLALHRNDEGRLLMTLSYKDVFQRPPPYHKTKAWMILDHFEMEMHRRPELEIKPVPLLVSRYEGRTRYFETPDDLERYYSGLGIDATRAAECLRNNVPVIFGKLTVHREKPWHFNDGHAAIRYGKRYAM